MRYGAVDLFSGAGGISLGLEMAGFNILLAFDINKCAVRTYNYNLGSACVVEDARNLKGEDIFKKIKLRKGDLPLLAGGPPCQGFSSQKKGAHLGDPRNHLILEYIRFVNEITPRFFLLENVGMFGKKRGNKYLKELEELADYQVYPHFYNSADYGLAQTRVRFIIVGRRKDQVVEFKVPKPVGKWVTVSEVIGDLPEPPMDYSDHPNYPNHSRARVSKLNIKRFSFVPQGGGWQDIPHELRLECHKKVNTQSGGAWSDVYGRLRGDGQCPTITGGFDSFTRGRYGHPEQNRPITLREGARLQGFPDSFVFLGNRGDVKTQIGNAVPPPLAKAIGLEIKRCLLSVDGG
jgi:DNA (cytosine-5)-methyltransferase 1